MWPSSYTIVPPRGVTCAYPLGSTEPTRHTLAGKAALMCGCNVFRIVAILVSPVLIARNLRGARGRSRRPPARDASDRPAAGRNPAIAAAYADPYRARGRPRSAGCGDSRPGALAG